MSSNNFIIHFFLFYIKGFFLIKLFYNFLLKLKHRLNLTDSSYFVYYLFFNFMFNCRALAYSIVIP